MDEDKDTNADAAPVADDSATTDAPVADSTNSSADMSTDEAPKAAAAPRGGDDNTDSKLFVGGISWGTTDEGLKAAFEPFGSVTSAEVIREKMTGRSKGFGFVVMGSAAEANAAVEKMNGQTLDGRQVTVNIARPKTESRDARPMRRY